MLLAPSIQSRSIETVSTSCLNADASPIYDVVIDIEVDKPSYILRFGDPYRTEVFESPFLRFFGAILVQLQ